MTAERRLERRLLADYEKVIDKLANELTSGNRELALKLASYPEAIKGFGHIKQANAIVAEQNRDDLLNVWAKSVSGEKSAA